MSTTTAPAAPGDKDVPRGSLPKVWVVVAGALLLVTGMVVGAAVTGEPASVAPPSQTASALP